MMTGSDERELWWMDITDPAWRELSPVVTPSPGRLGDSVRSERDTRCRAKVQSSLDFTPISAPCDEQ